MQAIRDRERERNQTVARKGAMADKQTKYPSLSGDGGGGWHIDGTVIVGQYTQTRQRRLRAKTIKSGHDRHYKKRVLS